jgi:hypothetical protein
MLIDIKSYWSVMASDYHEFGRIARSFKQAGIVVNYQEVGCNGQYEAVFWIKNRPNKYINERKAKYNNMLVIDY